MDCELFEYKNRKPESKPVKRYNLLNCEITPNVDIRSRNFELTLHLISKNGSSDSQSEIKYRFKNESIYLNWKSAFKLASVGKSMASAEFDDELEHARKMFMLMQPNSGARESPKNVESSTCALQQFSLSLPRRLVLEHNLTDPVNSQDWKNRILQAHANVKSFSLSRAKQAYIDIWRTLPDHGFTYFLIENCSEIQKKEVAKNSKINAVIQSKSAASIKSGSSNSFEQSSQDCLDVDDIEEFYTPPTENNNGLELFKIGADSLAICGLNGIAKRSFRYNELCEWTVNNKKKSVKLKIQGSSENYYKYVNFTCFGFRPRLVQEFIGGYVFLQVKEQKPEDATEDLLKKLISNRIRK